MELKGSLPGSRQLVIDPNPQSHESSPLHLFKFQFNIFLPYMPRPSKQSLSFTFDNQNSVYISFACILHVLPI